MTAVAVLARTEALRCIDAFSYLLGCDIVMMRPLIHVLILLEMVYLLVLAVGSADCLLAISYSLLKKDAAGALHIRTIALGSFVHVLEIVRLRHTLGLPHHTWVNVLILSCNLLVGYVGRCLNRLSYAEFEQFFDVLWGDLGRCALPDLDDLALRIVVRLRRILLYDP